MVEVHTANGAEHGTLCTILGTLGYITTWGATIQSLQETLIESYDNREAVFSLDHSRRSAYITIVPGSPQGNVSTLDEFIARIGWGYNDG
jgi:hypothetical protein